MANNDQLDVQLIRIAAKLGLMLTGVHEAAHIVPMPSAEDFDRLCEDMREKGQVKYITLTRDGKLLDGRSRLLACAKLGLEPKTTVLRNGITPLQYSISVNVARRQLTAGQKAAVAAELEAIYSDDARERQREGGRETHGHRHQTESTAFVEFDKSCNSDAVEHARAKAAADVGVAPSSVHQFKTVAEHAPEAAEEVKQGKRSLNDAHKEAVEKRRQTKMERTAQKKAEGNVVLVHGLDGDVEVAKPDRPTFNKTNDNVSWAQWTWNPVTGCNHGCKFCYAREIANTMHRRDKDLYPLNFAPAFYPHRLAAPKNSPVPKSDDPRAARVFVCSMADLFGKWVPDHWIAQVFDACLANPQWQYLFLTKWPNRYAKLPLIEGTWYGASVVQQVDVKRVTKAMQAFSNQNVTRWISLEPMLEAIHFEDLSWCDLMVIGAQTATQQPDGPMHAFAPKFEWVAEVVAQCRNQNIPVYLKPNLRHNPGMELPQMNPRR